MIAYLRGEVKRELTRAALEVPGVKVAPGGVCCAWDAVPALCDVFSIDPNDPSVPKPPLLAEVPMPGLAEYKRLGFHETLRAYQKDTVRHLIRRAWAFNCLPMRAGKSFTIEAGAVLIGAERVLIACPSMAKWVWADELRKWCKQPALVLDGRGGDEARLLCLTCAASGRLPDGSKCPDCRAKNNQSYGYRIFEGVEAVREAMFAARWVIVNADILTAHKAKTDAGVKFVRQDLPGFAGLIASVPFDLAVGDEVHMWMRGRGDYKRPGESKRERFIAATNHVPRVWLVTGTPYAGFTRDIYGALDAMSNGLYGRPHFTFDVRYCGGRKGEYGWENSGTTEEYAEELKERTRFSMFKRSRDEILPNQPKKVRQVVHLDVPVKGERAARAITDKKGRMAAQLRKTAEVKLPYVADACLAEMAEGNKVFILGVLRDNVAAMAKELGEGLTGREWGPRLRQVDARIWHVHGEMDTKVRFEQAKAFREWKGAAAFVATIQSMQVAMSLRGAASVHFFDLTHEPDMMLQAEDRPFEVGVQGLTIVYYIVKGSIDEDMEALLLPKLETLERMSNEKGAGEISAAFGKQSEEDLAEAIWRRQNAAISGAS